MFYGGAMAPLFPKPENDMKYLFIIFAFLISIEAQAQRIAVLEFEPGVGVSSKYIDGLSSIFITYFSPNGYTLVERTLINAVIKEQHFQRSAITEHQAVKLGKILNVKYVVTGKINEIRGEYNVDVRVINVENGSIIAAEGDSFGYGSYRVKMKGIASRLSELLSPTSKEYSDNKARGTIPESILNTLYKNPKPNTYAIYLYYRSRCGQAYYADKATMRALKSLPNKSGFVIGAIILKGGEEAYGISLKNREDSKSLSSRFSPSDRKEWYKLPTLQQAQEICKNIDVINDLLSFIDCEEMHSCYWTKDNNDGVVSYIDLSAPTTNEMLKETRIRIDYDPNKSDFKAFNRDMYDLADLKHWLGCDSWELLKYRGVRLD